MNTIRSTLTLPASVDNLPHALAFAEINAEAAGVMTGKLTGLCLAVEEAFVNIFHHAYKGGSGQVDLTCYSGSESFPHSFVLEIADSGPEFDLFSIPEPDTSLSIDVTPEAILTHANEELASDNDACMFVTLFCGILNTKSGVVEWLPRAKSLMAGPMQGVRYDCEQFTLSPGDSLFLYTDGVTEAMNHNEDLFSEQRLEKDLTIYSGFTIKETLNNIMGSIQRFADGAPQSDDITMMMIKYSGSGNES
jgi:anti-sigma regulatory factor (Ser/Thr protein kinase)